ncbi:MAG: TetR/AcrR family transcriptional regulator [Rhodospirillaceae bacterium]|nr:TetR/AcrR family transcriptional regulator [Rhodospirillaceae bacterium]
MNNQTPRPRGRPLKFDRDKVLDRAVDTFWANGYTATSLEDLTTNMGINRPSLYAAFGNKHDLFMKTIDRYAETIGRQPLDAFLEEPDIRRAVEAYFQTTIQCVTSRNRPRGCLIMNVAGERAANDAEVRGCMADAYDTRVATIAERLGTARNDGQLPVDADPESLARMITSVMHSLAARARAGGSRKELSALAQNFLNLLIPDDARTSALK